MLIMMRASRNIIHNKLEAVVVANGGQIENRKVLCNFEYHKNVFQLKNVLSGIS